VRNQGGHVVRRQKLSFSDLFSKREERLPYSHSGRSWQRERRGARDSIETATGGDAWGDRPGLTFFTWCQSTPVAVRSSTGALMESDAPNTPQPPPPHKKKTQKQQKTKKKKRPQPHQTKTPTTPPPKQLTRGTSFLRRGKYENRNPGKLLLHFYKDNMEGGVPNCNPTTVEIQTVML